MAVNLVSLVMDVLTPDIIGKIANSLGLDRGMAQQATGASVPALLAAVAGAATRPGGANSLFNAVSGQDPGVLSNLAKTIDGSGQSLAEQGSGVLSSLLGGSTQSELANAIGKFTGVTAGKSSALLGLLSPIVLATLGKLRTSSGLDANGLVNLLASQKDNIAAALPAGLGNLLRGTNVLDGLGARPIPAAPAAAPTARPAPDRGSSFGWLTWAIPVLALLALGWYFFAPRAPKPPAPTTTTTTQPAPAEPKAAQPAPTEPKPAPTESTTTTQPATTTPATGTAASLTVDGVDLRASATSAIDDLKTSLQGVTDTASAQAALPKLQSSTEALEKVRGLTDKLSPEQKSTLAGLITAAMPTINPLIDKIMAIPGVSAIAKPAIDSLRTQLDALAKA